MQSIADVYNYPKIYAWEKIPNIMYYTGKAENKYDYYILEERVKGRDLYYGFLHDSYGVCKDQITKTEFYNAIIHPQDYFSLFNKIVELYIQDYIKINEFLESMNENDISNFLTSSLEVDKICKFLYSDIHPTNVLITDQKKLRSIDPMVDYLDNKDFDLMKIKDSFANKVVMLFWANEMIRNETINSYFRLDKEVLGNRFEKLQRKNAKICKAAMLKFIKIMNKYCDNPMFIDESKFQNTFLCVMDIFGDDIESPLEIKNELNIGFEK